MKNNDKGAAKERSWVAPLLTWYKANARSLPWRDYHGSEAEKAYRVWVSEIMLQQTRIETVKDYYARFLNMFPTVSDLAKAPEEKVLKMWEGLGYYSRARNLHKAAQIIAVEGFPSSFDEIRKLPGIGDYTAGAIAAIAFGKEEVAVDGNVLRVISRLEEMDEDVLKDSTRKKVSQLLKSTYPAGESSAFVQGLMELGEVVCLPQAPCCSECPVKESCRAEKSGRQAELPVRVKKTSRKEVSMAVMIVKDEQGKLLLFKRPEGVLKGLYELPNVEIAGAGELERPEPGNVMQGQTGQDRSEQAHIGLEKAMQEKYGIRLSEVTFLKKDKHVFTHITWHMDVYEAKLLSLDGLDKIFSSDQFILSPKEEVMLPTAFKKLLG